MRPLSILLLLVLTAPAALGCGRERWPVKVGDDADAARVDLTKTVPSDIATLDALPAPDLRPEAARASATEETVFVVEATLTSYKHETDGDYHLVLTDEAGHTLIAEIPDPACVGAASPLWAGIVKARGEFDAKLKAGKSFRNTGLKVRVTGVGFFDFNHHQRGVAPNAIELHPVLDIQFAPAAPGG